MYEPDNLREALKTLIAYNATTLTTTCDDTGNEREAQIEDLQAMNLDVLYAICDLLGMDDVYME